MKIAILGGTGPEGSGLGLRWAASGHEVIIGSRLAEKGITVANELKALLPEGHISGTDNLTASQEAELIVLAVPYGAQESTMAHVREAVIGKLLVTVVAPTQKPKARVWRLPSGLSAAEELQIQLGPEARIVAAFQNIGAHQLMDLDFDLDCDVLICGNSKQDKEIAAELCTDAGLNGVNAGSLQNSSVLEGLTSVLIGINIRNKVKSAGIRITGI